MKQLFIISLGLAIALFWGCKGKVDPRGESPAPVIRGIPVELAINHIEQENYGKKIEIVGWRVSEEKDEFTVYWHWFMQSVRGDVVVDQYKRGGSMTFYQYKTREGDVWGYRGDNDSIILLGEEPSGPEVGEEPPEI